MTARRSVDCVVCGTPLRAGDEQLVLARGRRRVPHCSEACLEETLADQRRARAVWRRRTVAGLALIAMVAGGAWTVRRHRKPPTRAISLSWTDIEWDKPARPQPIYEGPAWPPTDADWMFAFDRARWTYPLPGPARRAPTPSDRVFGEPARGPAPVCRAAGACGVALGGELWGEHVYAVLDGVVERVRSGGGDEHGGGTVRIAHFGGMVYTQYFHLAAIPRGVARGAHVAAGDVIGLLGDTGTGGERAGGGRAHLHFALSIRPSADLPETYWDPTPLMARWSLHVPPHGTVAGLTAGPLDEELLRRRRGR